MFHELIYKAPNTDYASRLCECVLRQCNQSEPHTRKQATAFLYLLMRKNFVTENYLNFTRIRVQTTLALSRVRFNVRYFAVISSSFFLAFSLFFFYFYFLLERSRLGLGICLIVDFWGACLFISFINFTSLH